MWLSHCVEKMLVDLPEKLVHINTNVKGLRTLAPCKILVSPFYF